MWRIQRARISWTVLLAVIWSATAVSTLSAQQDSKKPATEKESSDEAIIKYREAITFYNDREWALAVDQFAEFLKDFGDDPLAASALHYQGVSHLQLGKTENAISLFHTITTKHSSFRRLDETYYYLGIAENRAKQFKSAAASFGKIAEVNGKSRYGTPALYYRAEALYSLAENERAAAEQKSGDEATKLRASSAKAFADAAQSYGEVVTRGDVKKPLAASALYGLGWTYEELHKFAEAGKVYDKFIEEHSSDNRLGEILLRKGETLFQLKQFDQAQAWFIKASETKDSQYADEGLMRQGDCLMETKKYSAAAAVYLSLPSKYPTSASRFQAKLLAARAFFQAGNPQQVVKLLPAALAAKGFPAKRAMRFEAVDLLAKSYTQTGQAKQALAILSIEMAGATGDKKWLAQLSIDKADAMFEVPAQRAASMMAYAEVAEKFPTRAAYALYMAGYVARDQSRHGDVIRYGKEYLKSYAANKIYTPLVLDNLGEARLHLRQFDQAEKAFRTLLKRYTGHKDTLKWKFRLGYTLHLQDAKKTEAIAFIEKLLPELKDAKQIAEARFWQGAAYYDQKKYNQSRKFLSASRAASADWNDADQTLLLLAESESAVGKKIEALATAAKLIASYKKSDFLPDAYLLQGNLQIQAGTSDAAIGSYTHLIDTYATSTLVPYALHGKGLALQNLKKYPASIEVYSQLIKQHQKYPRLARVQFDRGKVYRLAGKFNEAVADLVAFIATEPNKKDRSLARLNLGMCHDRLGNFAKAINTYQSLLVDDPEYGALDDVLYELGWSQKESGDEKSAATTFSRLVEQRPDSRLAADAFYILGEIELLGKKSNNNAIAFYQQALKTKQPPSADLLEKIRYKLGRAYFQKKDYEAAAEWFDQQTQAAESGPRAGDGFYMLGESRLKRGQYKEALLAYEASLEKNPSKEVIDAMLVHAGQSARMLEQWQKSLKLLDRCLSEYKKTPYRSEALFEKGMVKNQWGQIHGQTDSALAATEFDEAIKLFESVVSKQPSALGAQARFMLADTYLLKKDRKKAYTQYYLTARGYGFPKAASAIKPWQAKAYLQLGDLDRDAKSIDKARRWYTTIVENFGDRPEAKQAQTRLANLK